MGSVVLFASREITSNQWPARLCLHCVHDVMMPLHAAVRGLRQDAASCSDVNSGTPGYEICGSLMRNLLIFHCIDHEWVRMSTDAVQLAGLLAQ